MKHFWNALLIVVCAFFVASNLAIVVVDARPWMACYATVMCFIYAHYLREALRWKRRNIVTTYNYVVEMRFHGRTN